MMLKYLEYIIAFLVTMSLLFIVGMFILFKAIDSALGLNDKVYSVSELKNEYFKNEKEIKDLIEYFNSIQPKDKSIDIEFRNNRVLERLKIDYKDSLKSDYQQWNVQVKSLLDPEFEKDLHWNEEQIDILKEKLDKANCISIEDGEPIKIGFKRSGMGMFSFDVFQKPETKRSVFNDSCQYILVNKDLALEYGGGAIGTQCFPIKN